MSHLETHGYYALLVYLGLLLPMVLFVVSTWALTVALGGRASAVQIGVVRVLRFKVAGVAVELGLLPFGSSVTLLGRAPNDPYEGPGCWRHLGLARRLGILLGPWMVTLVVAILCLSPARALASFARAAPQVLLVLDTTPLVRGFLRVVRAEPFTITLGVLCAKLTAVNLLPLSSLAGGAAIGEITSARRPPRKAAEAEPRVLWLVLSMVFLTLYVGGRFAWGLFQALSSARL